LESPGVATPGLWPLGMKRAKSQPPSYSMTTIPTQPNLANFQVIPLWDPESDDLVSIPASANTLAGFREWALSDDFPERGKITYVAGGLIVENHLRIIAISNPKLAVFFPIW